MNLGKSIKVALAKREQVPSWLAIKLSITRQRMNQIIRTGKTTSKTMEKIASALEMNLSELIALGEDE